MKRFLGEVLLFFVLFVSVCVGGWFIPMDPDNYLMEYDVKIGMLDNPDRRPALVLLGGSGSAFGFISPMIEDSLEIPVINVAIHAGLGQNIIVNDCYPHLNAGDIVVYSPEYSTLSGKCGGDLTVNQLLMCSDKFDRNIMTIANWENFIQNVPQGLMAKFSYLKFLIKKCLGSTDSDIYAASSFNSNGDVVAHWKNAEQHYNGNQAAPIREELNKDFINKIIATLDKIGRDRVILYPPPLARSSFELQRAKIDEIGEIFSDAGFPFICDPIEESYPDSAHYDTEYHLRRYAAEKHTKHLIELLKQRELCSSIR